MLLRNILLAVGVFVLLVGAALGVTWIYRGSSARVEGGAGPAQQVAVLTASHPIPTGALLRDEDMSWRTVPPGAATGNNLLKSQVTPAQFVGAVTRRSFVAGEPLVRTGLLLPSERGFLAAVLAPGDRAVTIEVDAAQSAAGLLLPGDRVDVVLVQDLGSASPDLAHKSVGETVLSDARVVAVDRRLSGAELAAASSATTQPSGATLASNQASTAAPKTLTLEVNSVDAQKLFVAGQLGKLQVSLRALAQPEGPTPVAATATWAEDVSPALQAFSRSRTVVAETRAVAPAGAVAPAPSPTRTAQAKAPQPVTILRGAKVESQ